MFHSCYGNRANSINGDNLIKKIILNNGDVILVYVYVYGGRSADLDMKLNEKNVANFAVCSSPIDREGYLQKKADYKGFQRRWFVLKGNLLFYFEKKQDKEPIGVVVLESCSVQASPSEKHGFEISFDGPGTRTYVLLADNDDDMQSWMRAISHSSYEYLRSIVNELQRKVNVITSSNERAKSKDQEAEVGGGEGGATSSTASSASGYLKPRASELHIVADKAGARGQQLQGPENGVVDVDQDESSGGIGGSSNLDYLVAPPIPPKRTRAHAHHHGTTQLVKAEVPDYDTPPPTSAPPTLPVKQRRTVADPTRLTLPPHSSPLAHPALVNTDQSLSPPATLDRTPILQPTFIAAPPGSSSSTLPHPLPLSTSSSCVPLSPSQKLKAISSSSSRQTSAAPPEPGKSMYEMHQKFQAAMKNLHSDRTNSPS